MFAFPPLLEAGDKVAITAPAKYIQLQEIEPAISLLTSWGLEIQIGKTIDSQWKAFSATDQTRLDEFQAFYSDPEIRAIFCARGGYGSGRISDQIQWQSDVPKWVIGFSDITSLLYAMYRKDLVGVHGIMPKFMKPPAQQSGLDALHRLLFEGKGDIHFDADPANRTGQTTGRLWGGNLTVWCHELASSSFPDLTDVILFLEDVDEYAYRIDRLFLQLYRSGILAQIKGLLIGGFTQIHEIESFGQTINEIVNHYTASYHYPVAFQAPFGHISRNLPLITGAEIALQVETDGVQLRLKKKPGPKRN